MLTYNELSKFLDRADSETNLHNFKRNARKDINIDDETVQKYIAASAKFGYSFTTLPNRLGLSYREFQELLVDKPFMFWSHVSGVQKYIEGLEQKYAMYLMSDDEDEMKFLAKKFDHWKRTISTSTTDMNALINKYEKELVDDDFLDQTSDLMRGV